MMKVLYTRGDGAKIVFDSQKGEDIMAHIELADGTKFEPKLLDNLVSKGYWEAVDESTQKARDPKANEPVTSYRLNRITIAIDQNYTKSEFSAEFGQLTEAESQAWDDIEKEITIFAKNGITVEIPAEIPDVFDTGLRK